MKTDLTFDQVNEVLRYEPDTGHFYWKTGRRQNKKGKKAGYLTKNGYIEIKLFGKKRFAHRLAWLLHYGAWPSLGLDHINRVKTDNRIENLREATHHENIWNRESGSDSMSGFRGVAWDKRKRRWVVTIRCRGERINVGCYRIFEDAVVARIEAEREHHGDFAPSEFNSADDALRAALGVAS